ncbi:MAG: ATP-binding protein [Candidatus Bilamarchaeaceae archaeon]
MPMTWGQGKGSPGVKGEKVEGTRFYLPKRLKKDADLLIEGIKQYKTLGIYGSFGALLKGIPGTGKTLFTRYVAEKTEALIYVAPMLYEDAQVRDIFDAARSTTKERPAVLVFDDLDYIGKRTEAINSVYRPVLAQLLTEMDIQARNIGVFTFITSNLPDMLDEALRRPPRITYEIEFLPPTRKEREEILATMLSANATEMNWSKEIIEYAAAITFGYTPGDLLGIVQNAMMQAIVRKSNDISKEDIDFAKMMQKPSAIRDLPFIEPTEKLNDIVGGYVAQQREMLAELAVRIDNGILAILYGPAGCGKTALAKAVAGQFGYNCLYFNPSDIIDKYVGEPGKALARAFSRAKALGPCVLILDQAEGIINPENPYAKEWTSVLKAQLSEPIPNVFVIMTAIDPSGWGEEILTRFHKIYVPRADERSQMEILKRYLPAESKVDIDKVIAASKDRLTPRDIKTVIRSIQDFGVKVTTETLLAVINLPRKNVDLAYEKQLTELLGDDTKIFAAIKGKGGM